ncbi:UDP-glucose 6-dehydrogenase [Salipaludibacillus neizhouensis]|uniref:UDP-glucose 6-dehydrogenase n=1 Tax=Salipaludibacillus neizhouensis TaxID=885475 RepID=A0A3A9KFC3_9BACI|nr:UDP-glucose/GDP-mannose dehydrogenase family protein [Salipaludibacillus neizhouensis]RKL69360.1 UDP-glucose 6-dehydrogenase [Salipaludibacillus neizhouensis]
MKICMIGTGYVGLTTGTVLTELGHEVFCVDKDKDKISRLNKGEVPIHEPGLSELIIKNKQRNNLHFTSDVHKAIKECSILFITVGTPPNEDGSQNLIALDEVVETLAQTITAHKTIIMKSTVLPGTNESVQETLIKRGINHGLFDIVSNPEFLREGYAVFDMMNPDRIVIGSHSEKSIKLVKSLYRKLDAPYVVTSLTGAEMIKYASNAFLATKISFINEIARICDAFDVEITDVVSGLATDKRISPHFLKAGLGYGGSCFSKDLRALEYTARQKNIITDILISVQKVNDTQTDLYIKKLIEKLYDLSDKKITVWGLSFKPDTDDIRDSRSLHLIDKLIEKGANVYAYDPIVHLPSSKITCHQDIYESIKGSDALILATEWSEFQKVNWIKVKDSMEGSVIVDGRNVIDPVIVKKHGFHYIGVARP